MAIMDVSKLSGQRAVVYGGNLWRPVFFGSAPDGPYAELHVKVCIPLMDTS